MTSRQQTGRSWTSRHSARHLGGAEDALLLAEVFPSGILLVLQRGIAMHVI